MIFLKDLLIFVMALRDLGLGYRLAIFAIRSKEIVYVRSEDVSGVRSIMLLKSDIFTTSIFLFVLRENSFISPFSILSKTS